MKRCPQCNRLYSDITDKCPKCGISLGNGTGSMNNSGYARPQQTQNQNSVQQPQNISRRPQENNPQTSNSNQQNSYSGNVVTTGKMGFGEAISACFSKYAQFSGRASRAEYWWFQLFGYLAGGILSCINSAIAGLFMLALVIPLLAVTWRRLHDVGKSGILSFVPIYNLILLLQKGEASNNQYGPVPVK